MNNECLTSNEFSYVTEDLSVVSTALSLQREYKWSVPTAGSRGDCSSDETANKGDDFIEYTYEVTGLQSTSDELTEWANFCSSIFSYKANPPQSSYFERHFVADPYHLHPSLIRVARFGNDRTIVASCRLFVKLLSSGGGSGKFIRAGGIGEVCTSPTHRKRGLSKQLLQDCIDIMVANHPGSFEVSLLHCSPAFFPVYQAAGYHNCRDSVNSTITIHVPTVKQSSQNSIVVNSMGTKRIRLAKFPEDSEQLQNIHREYSEHRFAGCVVRSMDYWNSYIAQELAGSLFVLLQRGIQEDHERVEGWMSIRQIGSDCYQMRDFGCDKSTSMPSDVLNLLLTHYVTTVLIKPITDTIKLQMPKPILDEIRSDADNCPLFAAIVGETIDIDKGWMYKLLGKDRESEKEVLYELDKLLNPSCPHVIWSADSF